MENSILLTYFLEIMYLLFDSFDFEFIKNIYKVCPKKVPLGIFRERLGVSFQTHF